MTTIRTYLESIRDRNAQWNNEECRDDFLDAKAALELLDRSGGIGKIDDVPPQVRLVVDTDRLA